MRLGQVPRTRSASGSPSPRESFRATCDSRSRSERTFGTRTPETRMTTTVASSLPRCRRHLSSCSWRCPLSWCSSELDRERHADEVEAHFTEASFRVALWNDSQPVPEYRYMAHETLQQWSALALYTLLSHPIRGLRWGSGARETGGPQAVRRAESCFRRD